MWNYWDIEKTVTSAWQRSEKASRMKVLPKLHLGERGKEGGRDNLQGGEWKLGGATLSYWDI